MSEIFHFPNASYVHENFSINIDFNVYSKRFTDAQQWLGDRILEDCKSFMPSLTGSMQQRSYVTDGGRKVVIPGPYSRFQYMGKVMVDPDTGSPWARKGVKKVVTDRPLTYSTPQATDHFFDTAYAKYGDYWISGVRQRLAGGK